MSEEKAPDSLDGIEMVGFSDAPEPKEPQPKEEPLELGSEEAPEATPEQVEEEKKKTRSQRWEKRVDTLTARNHQLERELNEIKAKLNIAENAPKDASVEEISAKKPDPQQFEFGEADPKYLDALTDWKIDLRDAQRREMSKEAEKQSEQQRAYNERVTKLKNGLESVEAKGREKYEDFDDKVREAAQARGEPLHPLISIGTAVSPAGPDIVYRLATDEAVQERLENLAKTNPQAAAMAFGELEGEYLESDDDSDLNLSDPLDMMRLNGRMKARLKGVKASERKVSQAPEPPETRARGATGRFTPDWSAEGADLTALGKLLG